MFAKKRFANSFLRPDHRGIRHQREVDPKCDKGEKGNNDSEDNDNKSKEDKDELSPTQSQGRRWPTWSES